MDENVKQIYLTFVYHQKQQEIQDLLEELKQIEEKNLNLSNEFKLNEEMLHNKVTYLQSLQHNVLQIS